MTKRAAGSIKATKHTAPIISTKPAKAAKRTKTTKPVHTGHTTKVLVGYKRVGGTGVVK